MEHDQYFRQLGATHYHDELYPRSGSLRNYGQESRLFARYYFLPDGTEVGYVIPDVGNAPNVHPAPRVWGIPHNRIPLQNSSES